MKYLIFYIASLALGGAGAWLISRWGTTMGLLDRANDRSSHKGVVPTKQCRFENTALFYFVNT